MILVEKLNHLLDNVPIPVKGFIGLYMIGLMILIPEVVLSVVLVFIFFSLIFSIWYKILTLVSEYILAK